VFRIVYHALRII